MLVKSLVAGTVLTLMAGGAVYYGTDVDATASTNSAAQKHEKMAHDKADHPHRDKSADVSENSSDIPSIKSGNGTLINPKADAEGALRSSENEASVKTAELKDTTGAEIDADRNESSNTETPTRKWIDQYLKSESDPTDEKSDETPADQAAEDIDTEMDVEAAAAMDAEIAEILAQEAAIEQEMAAMMAEMGDTEMLEQLEVEIEEGAEKVDVKDDDAEADDETVEIEVLTDEEILEAETKGFKDRAKDIENIWVSKEDGSEEAPESDPKTLDDILKSHNSTFIGEGAKDGDKTVDVKVIKNENGTMTTETETIDLGDGNIMKIVKVKRIDGTKLDESSENKIRIKVMTPKEHSDHKKPHEAKSHDTAEDHSTSDAAVSDTIKIIMAQAEKISMPELRDRAYLDLVSYALSKGDKAAANRAMTEIEQVELRDTARNRMAVNYAQNGNAEKAFAILEELEVDALRDVMRLQVIEALIVPEAQTSQDMQ